LQAFALYVEQPTMKGAAQPTIFKTTISQVSPAMWACATEKAVTAFLVSIDNEVFAKQPDWLDRPAADQFVDQRRRLPISAQQRSPRRTRSDTSDAIVLLCAEHG
jgi:hypothetical protein